LFAWRDAIKELLKEKAVLGFSFGKPLRSKAIEIMGMGYSAWSSDGWISLHNSYIELIYRSGIVGIILILCFFAVLFRMIKEFVKSRSFTGILLVSIIVYWLVTAFFYVTFELPYSAISFWSLFGISLAYCHKVHISS
jgi:O-antigen ligase